MQLISDEYRRLNETLHHENGMYGMGGANHAMNIIGMSAYFRTEDILDYGCGKGMLGLQMPFPIQQYDPAVLKRSSLPMPADIVVCTDVLEHVEPECIDAVLMHLKDLTKRAGYFTIGTTPATKILADGRNAHLIVQPVEWWREKIALYFEIKTIEALNKRHAIVLVEPL